MMTLELDDVDMTGLLHNSFSIVREKASSMQVRLELELAGDLGELRLDQRKTKQIVYNLLSNAVKFSNHHGHVVLSAQRVRRAAVGRLDGDWPVHRFAVDDNEFEEFLEICVTDHGIGISEADMTKLFRAFTQIDSSLSRRFEGTGLGLAMVKQMAELHGGTVAVASAEGRGSRFGVWLPVRRLASTISASKDATWHES